MGSCPSDLQERAARVCCGHEPPQHLSTELHNDAQILQQDRQSQAKRKPNTNKKTIKKDEKPKKHPQHNNAKPNKDNLYQPEAKQDDIQGYSFTISSYHPADIEITHSFSYTPPKQWSPSPKQPSPSPKQLSPTPKQPSPLPKSLSASPKQPSPPIVQFASPYWSTLTQITSQDDVYYAKCTELCSSMCLSLLSDTPIQHDVHHHKNNWDNIRAMAKLCQHPLYRFLQNLVDSIKFFPSHDTDNDERKETEVIKASLKKQKRSEHKVLMDYNGNWLRLVDVCRASIVHNNFKELYYMLLIIAKYNENCFGFQIIKIENGYKDTTEQGWAHITLFVKPIQSNNIVDDGNDLNVECSMDEQKALESITFGKYDHDAESESDSEHSYDMVDEWEEQSADDVIKDVEQKMETLPGHICEVQLIHRSMWNSKKHGVLREDVGNDRYMAYV